jgi:hypothetical protein
MFPCRVQFSSWARRTGAPGDGVAARALGRGALFCRVVCGLWVVYCLTCSEYKHSNANTHAKSWTKFKLLDDASHDGHGAACWWDFPSNWTCSVTARRWPESRNCCSGAFRVKLTSIHTWGAAKTGPRGTLPLRSLNLRKGPQRRILSVTESSLLMLRKIWGFRCGDSRMSSSGI